MRRYFAAITVVLLLVLQGCHVTVSFGGRRFEGAGVIFVVPLETSDVSTSPYGIDYKSSNLGAHTDGKSLLVNGKSYGFLKAGDVVDFTQAGVIKVNDVPREPTVDLPAFLPCPAFLQRQRQTARRAYTAGAPVAGNLAVDSRGYC